MTYEQRCGTHELPVGSATSPGRTKLLDGAILAKFVEELIKWLEDRKATAPGATKVVKEMIEWHNQAAAAHRQSAAKLARENKVCRICLKEPTMPLRLDFGNEYACEKCLEGRARI